MSARAGVSESVFYEFFASVEECYRAVYAEGLTRLARVVDEAAGRERGWTGRLRAGLVALLGFFDDEPAWARLLVLETPLGGASMVECRRGLHAVLARLLDQDGGGGFPAGSPMLSPALTGELVVGGVYSVVGTSMLEDDGRRLVELAPPLMVFIAAQCGVTPPGREALANDDGVSRRRAELARVGGLPVRATRRTMLALRAIAHRPYSNNREVALAAGLSDEGQTSKLLARLERQGVVENVGVGAARGEPNAWLLTAEGQRALDLLADSFADRTPRACFAADTVAAPRERRSNGAIVGKGAGKAARGKT